MRLWYDFHLHSCLSPCGDDEMTPYNLVNLAKLLGYDVIALTDHNTVGNCAAAMTAGEQAGLLVLPGMELCTAEEIHMVYLFPSLDRAEAFGGFIRATLPPVGNKPEIFGRQLYMDETDNILGSEDCLLVTASSVSVEDAVSLAKEYGGYCFPAHIDRASYSVLSSLGAISPGLGFNAAEISLGGDPDELRAKHPILEGMRILRSSDAHYLENMPEPRWVIRPQEATPASVLTLLQAGPLPPG